MICELIQKDEKPNWCEKHKQYHRGHYAKYAVDPGEKGQRFRKLWDEQKDQRPTTLLRSLPLAKQCSHNTGENGRAKAGCTTCVTYGCSVKGTVRVSDCVYCEDWKPAVAPASHHENRAGGAGISWPANIRFDHTNLFPGEVPGMRFNCSIIESGGGFIFAFRNGWAGSRLYLCRLTSDFKPVEKSWAKLQLPAGGQEDPRLFRLNGVLHLWYICYFRNKTSVRFCRINEETLSVEDEFFPQIPHRQPWEKNHSYFDYQGIAHAVYTVSPHKIIRVEGNSCQHAYNTPYPGSWSGGAMRGGASPVLHNGEYYHFFHGAYDSVKGRRRYCTGVYTFRSEPPFDVLRFTPHPIDQADLDRQHDNWCDVLFIGGSLYRDGMWITANGVHDRWSEIRFYDGELVESQLEKVK